MENNTEQAAPAEQLDTGAQAPAESAAGSASEQPVDHRTDLAADADADTQQSGENAYSVESLTFPERAFTEGDTDGRVQSSAQDRVFVAGVGFVDVSHPKE